jgi:hypothetical protein
MLYAKSGINFEQTILLLLNFKFQTKLLIKIKLKIILKENFCLARDVKIDHIKWEFFSFYCL